MKWSRNKKRAWLLGVSTFIALIGVGGYCGIRYLYDFAIERNDKSFMDSAEASGTDEKEIPVADWPFLKEKPIKMTQHTPDGLTLRGNLLKNPKQAHEKTPRLLVLVHGYTSNMNLLQQYADMFYKMGYDLFLADARGHGTSDGNYIGFGWPDRLDLVRWIEALCQRYNQNVAIGLWGVSMGGAEVMMASGEKLPKQVRCIIEDCGYTSTADELEYQLKSMFHLPSFPIIPLASAYTNHRAGYDFYESSAIDQLKKNHLPMLFIHGSDDTFVPSEMVDEVYNATKGPKEKLIVKGAGHAKSFSTNPAQYKEACQKFLNQYLPAQGSLPDKQ